MTKRKLVSIDEAVPATEQHTAPCSDCPWSRESLKGWLGGMDVDTWLRAAHGNEQIDCHTLLGSQCAGSAVYRANCGKRNRPGSVNLVLPKDTEHVFGTPMEFKAHHE